MGLGDRFAWRAMTIDLYAGKHLKGHVGFRSSAVCAEQDAWGMKGVVPGKRKRRRRRWQHQKPHEGCLMRLLYFGQDAWRMTSASLEALNTDQESRRPCTAALGCRMQACCAGQDAWGAKGSMPGKCKRGSFESHKALNPPSELSHEGILGWAGRMGGEGGGARQAQTGQPCEEWAAGLGCRSDWYPSAAAAGGHDRWQVQAGSCPCLL